MAYHRLVIGVIAGFVLAGAQWTHADSFVITSSSSTPQVLGPDPDQTGLIGPQGSLTTAGATPTVTVAGSGAELANYGTVNHSGNGNTIVDTGGYGLNLTNNGHISAQAGSVVVETQSTGNWTINNYQVISGQAQTLGSTPAGVPVTVPGAVIDFSGVASGTNVINNFGGAYLDGSDEDVIRAGVNGRIYNAGSIGTIFNQAYERIDAIAARQNSGVEVINDSGGDIFGLRHAISGGPADAASPFTMTITNNVRGTITGYLESGIDVTGAQSVVHVTNHGQISGAATTQPGAGLQVEGSLFLQNDGNITFQPAFSSRGATIAANLGSGVVIGGGEIVNSGSIQGMSSSGLLNFRARGVTISGASQDTSGNPILPQPIVADVTVTNSGLIQGQTDSGIAVEGGASGHAVTINNLAGGTIEGGGTAAAAIQTGADNATINNAGTIKADASGKAVTLGAGNDQVNITGGQASVVGNIDGGAGTNTLRLDPGLSNKFSYSGSIANFSTVEVQSGLVTLTGSSSYSGVTKIDAASELVLVGANRLSTGASLDLAGGYLKISGGGANGATFVHLTLEDSSVIDLDHSTSVTFGDIESLTAGKTLSFVNYDDTISPDYAFRFAGDQTQDADFLALMSATNIDGSAVQYHYDGIFTDVTLVPEPSTLLFGFALVGMIGWRRRTVIA